MRDYDKLDEMAADGRLTDPQNYNWDMDALRKYCKEHDKAYEDLTKEELDFFLLEKTKIFAK